MHADTNRSVLHPVGRTQPFNVERGVPQGAVESPWVYFQFIDGLACALKSAGLGVWIAGVQVPLLMYADDMVFMVSSVSELRHMMAIATTFTKKNRFQFNGKKSAVMVVNAKARLRAEAAREAWSMAGEPVKVKDKYVYLGTTSTTNEKDWSTHLRLAIDDSEKASAALLRVLRLDKGMRPRTAIYSACGSRWPWFAQSLSMLARYGTGRYRPPWSRRQNRSSCASSGASSAYTTKARV